ncbi:rsbT co-antagonist protein RsbR [Thalassobacillus pellis]|nr:rsbT co-antagonist protein RsbR [Thalassobacillus pellis]
MMRQVEHFFPLPFIRIDKHYNIQCYSPEMAELTRLSANLLDLLDEGSISKVQKGIIPSVPKTKMEVNLNAVDYGDAPILIDLFANWINDLQADIILMEKGEGIRGISDSLQQLRTRLQATNFELLEEKDKLQKSIEINNRLSAPFIELTEETALIPLFGDISVEKLYAIESNTLDAVQQTGIDCVLFDFTAVGELNGDGVHVLQKLVQSIIYMGVEVAVVGIKPSQAKRINELGASMDIRHIGSLQQAIKQFCN